MAARYNYLILAIALIAGAVIGFTASTVAFRHHLLRMRGEQPLERMTRELKLTSAQRAQLHDIVEGTRAKITDARRDCERQRRKLMANAYAQFRAVLKAPQQKLLDRDFVPPEVRAQIEENLQPDSLSSPPSLSLSPSATATRSMIPTPMSKIMTRSGV